MNFNYNIEIEKILNKIYEQKIYDIAMKENLDTITKENISNFSNLFKSYKVYLGSDMDNFIVNSIPADKDGYFFRASIAKHKNYSYPKLYDYLGNPLKNVSYRDYAYQLWEEHMNEMLIADIQYKFNQNDFIKFVDENLDSLAENIISNINEYKNSHKITIPLNSKEDTLEIIKSMILNKDLDFTWAELLIDMDAVRNDLALNTVAFHMYNEFDKVEDELEISLNKFCKYNSLELFDLLTKKMNFKFIENIGLVSQTI